MTVHLLADDHALSAGGACAVLVLRLAAALRAVRVAAARAVAVELDAGAGAGDAVALAGAAGRDGRSRAWGAAVAAAGAERWDIGLVVGVRLLLAAVLLRVVVDLSQGELPGELLNGLVRELLGGNLASCVWLSWLRALDLGWRERAALGDIGRADAAGVARGLACRGLGRVRGLRDVEGVELAAGGGLGDGLAGWVVGDVVAIDDVVVPVSLALLQGVALEAEGALPATSLAGVLGQRELAIVVVPGAEEMDGLAVGGGAEGEVKLNSCHFEFVFGFEKEWWLQRL